MKSRIITAIVFTWFCNALFFAQTAESLFNVHIENEAEDKGLELPDRAMAYQEAFDKYVNEPIDIHSRDARILVDLNLMSEIQYHALQRHIHHTGPLLAIEELQAIAHFSAEDIRRLKPLITIRDTPSEVITNPLRLLRAAQHRLLIRYSRTLESSRAYTEGIYSGDPARLLLRYRALAGNRFQLGFTAEKDPGEPFFRGSNTQGFDFYSGHLYLKSPLPFVRDLVIGDYSISMGEGLLMHSGFGYGKSSLVTQIKKSARTLKAYSSTGEAGYLRGIALSMDLTGKLASTVFISRARRDANIEIDSLEGSDIYSEGISSASFNISGLHRTTAETGNKHAVSHHAAGMILSHGGSDFSVATNFLWQQVLPGFLETDALYRKYIRPKRTQFACSMSYSWFLRNIHLFGETALDQDGDPAMIHGIQAALDEQLDVALLFRYVPQYFHAMQASFFAETGSGTNEIGYYLGLTIRPVPKLEINTYYDLWYHPWLRYTADAPSRGNEFLFKVAFTERKQWNMYLQWKCERKELNLTGNLDPVDMLAGQVRQQVRLHFAKQWNRSVETRNRLELSWYTFEQASETGTFIAQDFLYKPLGSPFSFTTRVAFFSTDDYASRIYAYENDVSYGAAVPAFAHKGMRYYLNLRYKGIRNLNFELRYARTVYMNRRSSGSGYDEIPSRYKSQIKVQCIYNINKS